MLVITLLVWCSKVGINANLALPRSTLLGYPITEWQSLINQLDDAETAHPLDPSEDDKHATPLTNFYFRLHRQLFASGHLPASEWGRAYPGQTPVGVHDLQHIDLSLMPEFTRASINRFWHLHRDDIPPNARWCGLSLFPPPYKNNTLVSTQVFGICTALLQHTDHPLPRTLDTALRRRPYPMAHRPDHSHHPRRPITHCQRSPIAACHL